LIDAKSVSHENWIALGPEFAMKNVTVSREESVADRARIDAALRNTSVSTMMADRLAAKMQHGDSCERPMRETLVFQRVGKSSQPDLTRGEICDRNAH
jgi:hypothetical protein